MTPTRPTTRRSDVRRKRRRSSSTLGKIGRFLGWCLFLAILTAFVSSAIVYKRADDGIRKTAQKILDEKFPGLEVSFASVRLDVSGVRLREVAFKRPAPSGESALILSTEEIYVECALSLKKVLVDKIRPTKITLRRPAFYVNSLSSTALADFALLQPQSDGAPSCPIEIHDASFIFVNLPPQLKNAPQTATGVSVYANPFYPKEQAPRQNDETRVQASNQIDPRASFRLVAKSDAPQTSVKIGEVEAASDAITDGAITDDASNPTNVLEAQESGWKIRIKVSNPYVKSLDVEGTIFPTLWSVRGAVDQLDLAPFSELGAFLPNGNALFANLRGKTSLDFQVSGAGLDWNALQYKLNGVALNGAATSPTLKYPLSDLEIHYSASNEALAIDRLVARCGLTTIKAAYRQQGPFLAPTSAASRARLENFRLDDALLRQLIASSKFGQKDVPSQVESFLHLLEDYQFSATTNVDVEAERSAKTGGVWVPLNLTVSGENAEFVYRQFPYRLDGLKGFVKLDREGSLLISLDSVDASAPVKIEGRFRDALISPRGYVNVDAKERLIDAKLLAAIPQESRDGLARLEPSGVLDVKTKIQYDPALFPNDPLKIESAIDVRNASLRYELFPMPVSSVAGTLYMRDGVWCFSDFVGKSGAASVRASGSLASGAGLKALRDDSSASTVATPESDANVSGAEFVDEKASDASPAPVELFVAVPPVVGDELPNDQLRFLLTADVQDFPLGEELRNALVKYDKKDEFEKLRLEGKIDGQIRIAYRTDQKKLGLEFDATPKPGTVSAQPDGFPFELKEIEGKIAYREGEASINGLRAKSGRTTYSANLRYTVDQQAGWTLDLSPLRVDQFQLDRDLQSAASKDSAEILTVLNPSGCFNIDGAVQLTKSPDPNVPLRALWDLRLVMQQNAAKLGGGSLKGVCGRIKIYGVADGLSKPNFYGEFDLDSLYYKELPISNLTGPFYYNGKEFFWGREAPPIRRATVYQCPFLKSRIDANPIYDVLPTKITRIRPQIPVSSNVVARAQASEVGGASPGFNNVQTAVNPATVPTLVEREPISRPVVDGAQTSASITTDDGRRSLKALIFQGQVRSDGAINFSETPTYRLIVGAESCSLAEASRFFAPGSKPLKGNVEADVSLQGEGRNIATLKGSGGVKVSDAELYELPEIIKIFQILSVQESDRSSAFDRSLIDFQVLGDRVQLTRVSLEGDAMTLFGDGWLTIREQEKLVDLRLNARLGNSSSQIPIISDVIGGVGDQLVQIRVEGNLSSPVVQRESIPGVKKAWWSVFPEQEPTPTGKAPEQTKRPILDAFKKLTGQ